MNEILKIVFAFASGLIIGVAVVLLVVKYYVAKLRKQMPRGIDKDQIEKFSSAFGRTLPKSKINQIAEMMNKDSFFRDLSKNKDSKKKKKQ